jgi:hypothetical protein
MSTTTAPVATTPSAAPALFAWGYGLALGVLLLVGLLVRLPGLGDPPFNFFAARQFFSANRAHALYVEQKAFTQPWEREVARKNANFTLEPVVVERIAAIAYNLFGEENLTIARTLSVLYWLLGGFFLYLLAARIYSSLAGLVAAAAYLFLPYGIVASQAFQPDPLMVTLTIAALYCIWRYGEERSLKFLLWGALCAAAAIYVKIGVGFFIAAAFAAVHFGRAETPTRRWWARFIHPHAWLFAGIALLPGLLYYLNGLVFAGFLTGQVGNAFVPAMMRLPGFWMSWWFQLIGVFGIPLLAIAFIGTFTNLRRLVLVFLGSLWLAYLLYGLFFTYAIGTHNYYQLPFIPILALGLAHLADIRGLRGVWRGAAFAGAALCLLVVAFGFMRQWDKRTPAQRASYRAAALHQTEIYRQIGDVLQHSQHVNALTEEYAEPLRYYGQLVAGAWPTTADYQAAKLRGTPTLTVEERMAVLLHEIGTQYFVITDLREISRQIDLPLYLQSHHPVLASTKEYIIFDLRRIAE